MTNRVLMKDHTDALGPTRPFIEERPSAEQLSELWGRFGSPRFIDCTWDLSHLDETFSPLSCSGEVVLVLRDDILKVAYVARRGYPKDWFFSMDRMRKNESVEEAAIGEAYEETGLKIDVLAIPLMYVVDIIFNDWTLKRWHFIVSGKPRGYALQPIDKEEIEEASFFQERPHNSDPFLKRWSEEIFIQV